MTEKRLVNYSIIFMALALLAYVLQLFENVMRPLAIALLLVFITTPLADFSRRKGIPAWISFTVVIILVIGLIILISSFVKVDNFNLANSIPEYQEKINEGTKPYLDMLANLGFGFDDISAQDIGNIAAKGVTAVLGAIQTFFSETLLALILLMFIVQSRRGLFIAIEKKYGVEEVDRLNSTLVKIQEDINAYFGTKSLISLGTALFSLVVLLIFQAKFVSISALLIFILNFIPIIGSLIAILIVIVLYLITFGLSMSILWLLSILVAIQFIFGNILEPKLTGKRLNMSPIVILISLYLWGWIWGIVGMFLSVPLTIMILILSKHFGQKQTT